MTKLMRLPNTQVFTLEIDQRLSGNTVEIVPFLKRDFSKYKFTFIIGSDQLPSFHKWGKWQELLQEMPFLVFPRAGYSLKPLYKGMQVLQHPLLITTNISSSLVRERVKQKLPIDNLVPPKIKDYIKKHKLYL